MGKRKRHSKYNSRKTEIDGQQFDSKLEAKRYLVLRDRQEQGVICDLELQPTFILQDRYQYINADGMKRTLRPIEYRADFRYTDAHGQTVVEDVKGRKTAVYQMKKKMFIKRYHTECEFREIYRESIND